MKVICYKNEDGKVIILCPCIAAMQESPSEDEFIRRVALKDVPEGTDFKIFENPLPINEADLPAWFDGIDSVSGIGMGHLPSANNDPSKPYVPSSYEKALTDGDDLAL